MKQSHLAKKIARAFVERIISRPSPEAVLAELKEFASAMESGKTVRDFFRSPLFPLSEKSKVLDGVIAKSNVSGDVGHVARMVLDHGVIHLLGAVVDYAGVILNERLGKTRATVVSAVELPADDVKRINEALNRITGRQAILRSVTDPSILGGVKVTVGSVVYDGSLRGQLENLREELIKR